LSTGDLPTAKPKGFGVDENIIAYARRNDLPEARLEKPIAHANATNTIVKVRTAIVAVLGR
jgi:hypothetical protein